MLADPVRLAESVMLTGRLFAPSVAESETVAKKEYVRSPAGPSPCVPSSKKTCEDDPPIDDKSATTLVMSCGGLPFVTATVSNVVLPVVTVDGLADPTPVGPLKLTHVEDEFCGSLGVIS